MLDRLEAKAREALKHPHLREVIAVATPAERDNPAALRRLLAMAAEVAKEVGHPAADGRAIDAALESLAPVERARSLRDEVVRVYHDPKLRTEAAAAGLDFEHLANHPDEAYALLVARGRLSAEADRALSVVAEVREFARESGAELPQAAATPLPGSADGQDAEIAALLAKGRLSPTEDERLTSLYENRVARQEAAEAAREAAGDAKASPDEYQTLIAKSVSSKLSPDENARLDHLAGARAISEGRADPEDLADDELATEQEE
jgi:hypothetical protein